MLFRVDGVCPNNSLWLVRHKLLLHVSVPHLCLLVCLRMPWLPEIIVGHETDDLFLRTVDMHLNTYARMGICPVILVWILSDLRHVFLKLKVLSLVFIGVFSSKSFNVNMGMYVYCCIKWCMLKGRSLTWVSTKNSVMTLSEKNPIC